MIIGIEKRPIVPTFDMKGFDYNPYIGEPLTSFDTDVSNYYLNKNDRCNFDIDRYFDLISAPYYVVIKVSNDKFDYSTVLKELFFHLFPTPIKYKSVNENEFSKLKEILRNYKKAYSKVEDITDSLKPIKQKLEMILTKLSSVPEGKSHMEYIEASKNIINKIQTTIYIFEMELRTTPTSLLEQYYYFNNPQVSWTDSPFAFFHNIIFNDGITELKHRWDYETQFFDESEKFEELIERTYEINIRATLKIIEGEVVKLKGKPACQQRFMNTVSESITNLYQLSFKADISTIYPNSFSVFQWLSLELKRKYKRLNIKTDVNDQEYIALKSRFNPNVVSKLITSLTGTEINKSLGTLFYDDNKEDFQLLMEGNIRAIKKLTFYWKPTHVYYLLYQLKNGALFRIKDLVDAKTGTSANIFIRNSPFKRGSYDTYTSGLNPDSKANTTRSSWQAIIDKLIGT